MFWFGILDTSTKMSTLPGVCASFPSQCLTEQFNISEPGLTVHLSVLQSVPCCLVSWGSDLKNFLQYYVSDPALADTIVELSVSLLL